MPHIESDSPEVAGDHVSHKSTACVDRTSDVVGTGTGTGRMAETRRIGRPASNRTPATVGDMVEIDCALPCLEILGPWRRSDPATDGSDEGPAKAGKVVMGGDSCALRLPSPATVRAGLVRRARYAFDGETFIHTGGVGDEFLVFVGERSGSILTRRSPERWAALPNLDWVRRMLAVGRLHRIGPSSGNAVLATGPRPSGPSGVAASRHGFDWSTIMAQPAADPTPAGREQLPA